MRPRGRATVSVPPESPWASCDRCGFLYNYNVLRREMQWQGHSLRPTGWIVCPKCEDTPAEFLRTIILPPDPVPVRDPRPVQYGRTETLSMATFDGANDYLTRGGGLTGIADSKEGTLSFWIRWLDSGGSVARVLYAAGAFFSVHRNAANGMQFIARNSGNTVIMDVEGPGNVEAKPPIGQEILTRGQRHILASWDLSGPTFQLYIDDVVQSTTNNTLSDDTIDYTRSDWAIGAQDDGSEKLNAHLGELWFDTDFLDLSIESNRRKFISSIGKPIALGVKGEKPTGFAPLVYCSLRGGQAVKSFATNRGTGGGFTVNGAFADTDSTPLSPM